MTRGDVDVRGHRPRVPGAARRCTIATARRSARCWRSTRRRSPTRARATPSARRAACAARSTASRWSSRTTSTCSACRRPAARARCVDHRPRLDSRMAAGMRRGGAVVLGKANLDEFPFGDFGISTRRRHDRQRLRSVAQHGRLERRQRDRGGRRASPRSASAPTPATRSRIPAAFASLATIRTTRGLTSRAGVMPLNPYNDAVGPMAKSVRDVALVLDLVTGTDAEDPVTPDAAAHIAGVVRRGPRRRDAEGHAHRRVAAALRRRHRRARDRGRRWSAS